MVEVNRHERQIVVAENALETIGFGGGLHDGVDFFNRRIALGREGQINEAHVDRGHAHGKAVELAVQFRQHKTDSGSRTGLGRDHGVRS